MTMVDVGLVDVEYAELTPKAVRRYRESSHAVLGRAGQCRPQTSQESDPSKKQALAAGLPFSSGGQPKSKSSRKYFNEIVGSLKEIIQVLEEIN